MIQDRAVNKTPAVYDLRQLTPTQLERLLGSVLMSVKTGSRITLKISKRETRPNETKR